MATREAFAFGKGPTSVVWVKFDPLLCLRQMGLVSASLQVRLPQQTTPLVSR